MTSFAVILPAAGRSTRFGDPRRKKPFVDLAGRPLWLRALDPFVTRDDVVQAIVAVGPDDVDWFRERFRPNLAFLEVEVIAGGAERADTVFGALERVRDDVDFVAVHDAARPLLAPQWVESVFAAAREHDAAIPGLPVAATVKRVKEGRIEATVDRTDLCLAQTPQVFRRTLLLEAFRARGELQPTDEAQLVETFGHPVHVVSGWPMNFKITTRDDLTLAEALVDKLPKPTLDRPLHPFADEDPRDLV